MSNKKKLPSYTRHPFTVIRATIHITYLRFFTIRIKNILKSDLLTLLVKIPNLKNYEF